MKPALTYCLLAVFAASIGGYAFVMQSARQDAGLGQGGHGHLDAAVPFAGLAIPLNVLSPEPLMAKPATFTAAKAGESIAWETNLGVAMVKAKATNKMLFVDFYTEWCGPCQQMNKQTFVDPLAIGAAKSFVFVKIDCDKEPGVAQQYGVTGYPTLMVLNTEGKPVQVGQGFHDATQLTTMLGHANAAQERLNQVRATANAQPQNVDAQLALADRLLRVDQSSEASALADTLATITTLTPAQQDALALFNIKLSMATRPTGSEQGITALSAFIKANPASPAIQEANRLKARAYMVEAYHLVRHGQRDAALTRLDALMTTYPESQEGKWANMMHDRLADGAGEHHKHHHGHNH